MMNADEVQWKEAPPILPGAQAAILYGDPAKEGVFVMRLKFPANYRVPPHTNPVDEIVTVISGEFNIGMGREFDQAQTKPYTAGGLIAMPPGRNTSSIRIGRLLFKSAQQGGGNAIGGRPQGGRGNEECSISKRPMSDTRGARVLRAVRRARQ